MRQIFILMTTFLLACKSQNEYLIKYSGIDMKNTILAGAEIRINKKVSIKNNTIVAFKIPNSSNVKILRILGSPGDKIEIINGEIYNNRQLAEKPPLAKKIYTIYLRNPVLFNNLKKFESRQYSDNYSMFSLSNIDYEEILAMNIVNSIYVLGIDSNYVESGIIKNRNFKYSNNFYFGPLKIPIKGTIIDDDIIDIAPLYLSKNDKGSKVEENYFFCIGDNFPESKNSRFIGLISESSILGVVDSIGKNTDLLESAD